MNVDKVEAENLMDAARIAEASERYDDMCELLKKLVKHKCEQEKKPLDVEERNLLSVAFKNVVGTKRQSWRVLQSTEFQNLKKEHLDAYKKIIENELEAVCMDVINLLEITTKVAKEENEKSEDVVFLLKMTGDYYRYLAEFKKGDEKVVTNAERYYKDATEVAKEALEETHPTRLGLALNYSVCCYEILEKKEDACSIAKTAFDSAIEKLDTLGDTSYKDSTLIMQLLRDNLTLWTAENDDRAE